MIQFNKGYINSLTDKRIANVWGTKIRYNKKLFVTMGNQNYLGKENEL